MVKTKDEVIKAIREKIGDDTSDEAISLLEDVTDTLNDFETRTQDQTDWKKKFEENDADWRTKYVARFSEPVNIQNPNPNPNAEQDKNKPLTFDDLFKEN